MQSSFKNLSVILPVMNEVLSLKESISRIESANSASICEYLLILSSKTQKDSIDLCKSYVLVDPNRYKIHVQTLPFLGGALQEAFQIAKGSHVLMMASDLETDPDLVPEFIRLAKLNPEKIITASRWMEGGAFENYGFLKKIFNGLFQKIISFLFFTDLSDLTYGFRVFPNELLKKIRWDNLRHPFLLETMLKPLRLGVSVIEIPAHWKARKEGVSHNNLMQMLAYLSLALHVRFQKKKDLLR